MVTENEAIALAATPEKIIDPLTCNLVISYLNGHITDLGAMEWELELAANNHRVILLQEEGKSIALKEAEWKISEPYKKWREAQLELRKLRAYRQALRKKEEILQNQTKPYGYPRAIN